MNALMEQQSAPGELVEFDVRKLARQARPSWQGGGDGVAVNTVEAMLDRMIEVLGFPGTSQTEHDVQTALKMARQIARDQDNQLRSAQSLLNDFLFQQSIADPEAEGTLETLQLTLLPVSKIRMYK